MSKSSLKSKLLTQLWDIERIHNQIEFHREKLIYSDKMID